MINLQEEKDLLNTVEISARRFEESPFIERHDTSKMIRGVYANRFQAVYMGEDPIHRNDGVTVVNHRVMMIGTGKEHIIDKTCLKYLYRLDK